MQDVSETKHEADASDYVALTADIVSAFVSNNSIPMSELANLLTSVHSALSGLAAGGSAASAKGKIERATAAEIKKSITSEALISFEDGKPYKTLRRHLTLRGLSPEAYREKWGLPVDYPMTSASYSAQRSELARTLGLGQQRRSFDKPAKPDETVLEGSKSKGRSRKASSGG